MKYQPLTLVVGRGEVVVRMWSRPDGIWDIDFAQQDGPPVVRFQFEDEAKAQKLYDALATMDVAENSWREAVLHELAQTHLDTTTETPQEILRRIIDWNVGVALDPAVSPEARRLVDRALAELGPATPQPQGDASPDYRAGYAAGVADVQKSPYYDSSADTKPAPQAGKARGEVDDQARELWAEWHRQRGCGQRIIDDCLSGAIQMPPLSKALLRMALTPQPQGDASPQVSGDGDVDRLAALCRLYTAGYRHGHHSTVEGGYTDVLYTDAGDYFADEVAEILEDRDFAALSTPQARPDGGAVAVVISTGYPQWLVEWLESPEYRQLPTGTKLYTRPAPAPDVALPQAFSDIRHWMEHCVSAAEEGVDYSVPRNVLDALTSLRMMEKIGRNRWSPTPIGEEVASYAPFAAAPQEATNGQE